MGANRPFGDVPSASERAVRVYRLLKREGRMPRDRIMQVCGFPAPDDQPVISYALFAGTIDRLNRTLPGRTGERIIGGIETGEVYFITQGARG